MPSPGDGELLLPPPFALYRTVAFQDGPGGVELADMLGAREAQPQLELSSDRGALQLHPDMGRSARAMAERSTWAGLHGGAATGSAQLPRDGHGFGHGIPLVADRRAPEGKSGIVEDAS